MTLWNSLKWKKCSCRKDNCLAETVSSSSVLYMLEFQLVGLVRLTPSGCGGFHLVTQRLSQFQIFLGKIIKLLMEPFELLDGSTSVLVAQIQIIHWILTKETRNGKAEFFNVKQKHRIIPNETHLHSFTQFSPTMSGQSEIYSKLNVQCGS